MRQRNLSGNRDKPFSTLRRSPRLGQKNQPESEYPKTPKCGSRQNRAPYSELTPLSSITDEDSVNKSQKMKSGRCLENSKRTIASSKSSKKVSTGSGKSTRLNGGAQGFPCVRKSARLSWNVEKIGRAGYVETTAADVKPKERVVDSHKRSLSVTEKRVTRSFTRESNNRGVTVNMKGCNTRRMRILIEAMGAECISDKGKASERGGNLSEQCSYKIEKRVTRSASFGIQNVHNSRFGDVKGSSDDGKAKLGEDLSTDTINIHKGMITFVPSAGVVRGEDRMDGFEVEKKQAGAKRKKIQVREEHLIFDGWTMEQELALERAYFAAKPTPNFWKKVAKMVPGKSAQECFDKIHSELMTPPQPQPRSRGGATKSSPVSLSASKLLNPSVPETNKRRYNKQKSHLAHKTVRQLLKKQGNLDHDNDADLFNVLEQTSDPPTQVVQDNRLLFTPERQTEGPGFDKKWVERSSACRKPLSRLNNSCESALTSPPVLKKIKNKALHEKYIDQLHSRGAKRNAASLRARKFIKGENGAKENNVQKIEAVKDAKNALVFCARDAVNQFQHLPSSKLNYLENTFDDFADISDNEIEDGS